MDGQVSPNYMRGSISASQSTYYINGDSFFPGKRVLFNSKRNPNFQSYLDHLTDSIKPSFGAVRSIYTPECGHRVARFEELVPHKHYVVGGYEKFRPYRYAEIESNPRKRNNKQNNYYVEPVYHSTKYRSSGKIKHIKREGKIIKCWPNGDDVYEPRTILLTSWMQDDIDVIKDAIAERLALQINGPVAKLYSREGVKINDPKQIEHGGHYIAVRSHDRLRQVHYRDNAAKNLMTSPRLDTKYLPPLSQSQKSSKFSTPDHSHPASSHGGSENSNNTYTQRYRKHQPKKEEDGVFHAKPVAHKRSTDRVKKVDYDKDEGGVFKAKGQNKSTRGAQEIEESNETNVDLPVDQREAEEVTEEPDNVKSRPSNRSNNNSRSNLPSQRNNARATSQQRNDKNKSRQGNTSKQNTRQEENGHDDKESEEAAAVKIQAHIRGYQTRKQLKDPSKQHNGYPSRTPTPPQQPKSQQQQNSRNNRTTSKPATKPTRHNPKPTDTQKNSKNQNSANPQKNNQNSKNTKPAPSPQKNGPSRKSPNEKKPAAKDSKKAYGDKEVKAATQIQAGFRGYKTRKEIKSRYRSPKWDEELKKQEEQAATKIQASFRGHKIRKDLKNSKKGAEENKNEAEEKYSKKEEQAAVKIQSSFRGFKTRKELAENEASDFYTEKEHNAAVKIQSSFRGFKTRKDMALQKKSEYTTREKDAKSQDPQNYETKKYSKTEEQAAVKIQTGMRGVLARKELARRQAKKLYEETEKTAMEQYADDV